MFALSKLGTFLFLPPGLLVLLLCLAAFLARRGRRRSALALILGAAALIYLLSARAFSDLLIRPLEDRYPPLAFGSGASGGGAPGPIGPEAPVVVLGGGSVDRSPEEGMRASLAPEPAKRLAYGLRVARALDRPLIFSGGRVWQGKDIESEADAARRYIEENAAGEAGRASYDDLSRTTRENARYAARLSGSREVVLVTSAYHMPRAVLSFKKEGLRAIAAPTDYKTNRSPYSIADFLPTSEAFSNSYKALHEYLGLLAYALAP